jgi:hypothetical protein
VSYLLILLISSKILEGKLKKNLDFLFLFFNFQHVYFKKYRINVIMNTNQKLFSKTPKNNKSGIPPP